MKVIYKILNKINGKFYIGSSQDFKSRKRQHLNELRKNIHHSILLQRAWNKYGEINFEFLIIENIDNTDLLFEREQFYLDNLNPEYNISKSAIGVRGIIYSEERRNNISKRMKKSILQYDKDMNFIQEWNSTKDASENLNISDSAIGMCCNGQIKTAKGFIFKFKDNFVEYKFKSRAKLSSEERRNNLVERNSKTYKVEFSDDSSEIVHNLKLFAQLNNFDYRILYAIANGKSFKYEKSFGRRKYKGIKVTKL